MMFLKREKGEQKLSTRVGIGFGLVALILIGTIAFTLVKIINTNKITENLSQITTPQIASALQLTKALHELMSNERDWLMSKNPVYQTARDNNWNKQVLPTLEYLKTNQANALSPEVDQLTSDIQVLYQSIQKADEYIHLSPKEQLSYFYTSIYPTAQSIEDILESLIKEKQNLLFSELQNTKKNMIYTLIVDGALLCLGLILCILLGIVLTNLITKPINKLVLTMDELAKGDLEQEIHLNEAYELQQLSLAINHVIQTLRDLANVTLKMSEGDYTHRVQVKSERDKLAISTNKMLDNFHSIVTQANLISEGNYSSEITPRSPQDTLGIALQNMTMKLRKNKEENDAQNWLKDGLANFANLISDARDIQKLSNDSLSSICRYTNAGMGAIYLLNRDKNELILQGSFAFSERSHLANIYEIGQGIIGQVAYENKPILLKNPKIKTEVIDAGLEQFYAEYIYAFPLSYEKMIIGVCELAWIHEPNPLIYPYLDSLMPILASHLQSAQQQLLTEKLLSEQKLLAEKLSAQQEELKASNEELEHQAQVLKASEEELRIKDEEQRKINHQLEERTKELENQKSTIENANQNLEITKKQLEEKAEELALASKYKSEFLANMSHELRTPLNSLLILAKIFSDNTEHNLTDEQVESAKIMLRSGQDLLTLINDILDLAKVEAGKLEVHFSQMNIKRMFENLERIFAIVAKDKNIDFIIEIDKNIPEVLITDEQRVTQIIRNLLSNAMKFTQTGHVKLRAFLPQRDDTGANLNMNQFIAFSVEDTGIGIAPDKQRLVFESFQQADGTTSRKYGGTGLGLSISKEFSKLLQGYIGLTSTYGKGSQFTLYLPLSIEGFTEVPVIIPKPSSRINLKVETPNNSLTQQHTSKKIKKLLLIEDDLNFSNALMTLCRKKGYLCRHVFSAEDALAILEKDIPDIILLDINLPGMNGIDFLNLLKNKKETAGIPVQIISALDENESAIKLGAIGYLTKPFSDEQLNEALESIECKLSDNIKNLLIIEDDKTLAEQTKKLIQKNNPDIYIDIANMGQIALDFLKKKEYGCIILDLGLPDISGFDLITQYHQYNTSKNPAVIIYTGRNLDDAETKNLSQYADSIIIKGGEASIDRLVQETMMLLDEKNEHLHRKLNESPEKSPSPQTRLTQESPHILLVDDDPRNLFAIKKILQSMTNKITTASDGEKAVELLHSNEKFNLILMDIMMPIMDGYEAIKQIRQNPQLKEIPIIALTAKALAGDKEKCLEAGANDYITKPIDMDILIQKVSEWLGKGR